MRPSFRKALDRVSRLFRPAPRRAPGRRARPELEALEDRRLLSTNPITDMTQWAQQFPAPTHPQMLFLNFDGGKDSNGFTIDPFVAPKTAAGQEDRDTAIQNILYQVSEIYSPFNVEVWQLTGNNNAVKQYGDTTVFIGGDEGNMGMNGIIPTKKFTYAWTPAQYADYAHPSDFTHAPNSDAYDLAYVDPMSATGAYAASHATWVDGQNDAQIAAAIAHEAGHTFGLAHVLASPVNDIMSYNSPNQYFANKSLPITTLNNSGQTQAPDPTQQPTSVWNIGGYSFPVAITTQNSFTYLQTILGKRSNDGYDHVSDAGSVDPSSTNLHAAPLLGVGSFAYGALTFPGEYDVYNVNATKAQQVHVTVTPDFSLFPDVLIKDSTGTVLSFGHAASANGSVQVSFQTTPGQSYVIVVGSEGTYNSGGFEVVTSTEPVPVLTGATFTFALPAQPGLAAGRLAIQSENVNSGTFGGVYTDALGIAMPVTGQLSATSTSASGVTTSAFSFSGVAAGLGLSTVQYSGTLTGKGSASPTGLADTLSGTIAAQDYENIPGLGLLPIFVRGGSATGKDF